MRIVKIYDLRSYENLDEYKDFVRKFKDSRYEAHYGNKEVPDNIYSYIGNYNGYIEYYSFENYIIRSDNNVDGREEKLSIVTYDEVWEKGYRNDVLIKYKDEIIAQQNKMIYELAVRKRNEAIKTLDETTKTIMDMSWEGIQESRSGSKEEYDLLIQTRDDSLESLCSSIKILRAFGIEDNWKITCNGEDKLGLPKVKQKSKDIKHGL